MKVLLTGGGTGGHILPLLNIGRELSGMGAELLYAGSVSGLESRMNIDIPSVLLPVSGWVRKRPGERIVFFPKIIVSILRAFFILVRFKPDAVVSSGGFVSIPVLIASIIANKPIYLIDINSIPGLATRLFSYFAHRIYLGFSSGKNYVHHLNRVAVTGIPVKPEMFSVDRREALRFFGFKNGKTLLIFGGSRGATFLVRLAESLSNCLGRDWQFIVLGTEKCNNIGRIRCYRFLNEMEYAYAASDVVVSRAGGMTIGEIIASGIPAVLIPYPYAYLDHQYYNAIEARKVRRNIAVIREEITEPEKVANIVEKLYGMRESPLRINPSRKIAEEIVRNVRRN